MRYRDLAVPVLLFLLAACGEKPTPPWQQERGYRWRELNVRGGDAGFTQIDGAKSGVTFQNAASPHRRLHPVRPGAVRHHLPDHAAGSRDVDRPVDHAGLAPGVAENLGHHAAAAKLRHLRR